MLLVVVPGLIALALALLIAANPAIMRWLDWNLNERGRKWFGEEPSVQRSEKRAAILRVFFPIVLIGFSFASFVQAF